MKVLIPNLSFYHFRNIAGCLQTVSDQSNVEVFLWNVEEKSMIDAFDDASPDLVFIHENQMGDAFEMLCKESDFKYVLVGSRENPDLTRQPSVVITSDTFKKNFSNKEKVISLNPATELFSSIVPVPAACVLFCFTLSNNLISQSDIFYLSYLDKLITVNHLQS